MLQANITRGTESEQLCGAPRHLSRRVSDIRGARTAVTKIKRAAMGQAHEVALMALWPRCFPYI